MQEEQTGGLAEKLRKLKLDIFDPAKEYESYTGLGPAASMVYFKGRGLSIGGYGELTCEGYWHESKKDQADALRFILYTGYKLSDNLVLNAAFEYEHAGVNSVSNKELEVFVEFAYIDFP